MFLRSPLSRKSVPLNVVRSLGAQEFQRLEKRRSRLEGVYLNAHNSGLSAERGMAMAASQTDAGRQALSVLTTSEHEETERQKHNALRSLASTDFIQDENEWAANSALFCRTSTDVSRTRKQRQKHLQHRRHQEETALGEGGPSQRASAQKIETFWRPPKAAANAYRLDINREMDIRQLYSNYSARAQAFALEHLGDKDFRIQNLSRLGLDPEVDHSEDIARQLVRWNDDDILQVILLRLAEAGHFQRALTVLSHVGKGSRLQASVSSDSESALRLGRHLCGLFDVASEYGGDLPKVQVSRGLISLAVEIATDLGCLRNRGFQAGVLRLIAQGNGTTPGCDWEFCLSLFPSSTSTGNIRRARRDAEGNTIEDSSSTGSGLATAPAPDIGLSGKDVVLSPGKKQRHVGRYDCAFWASLVDACGATGAPSSVLQTLVDHATAESDSNMRNILLWNAFIRHQTEPSEAIRMLEENMPAYRLEPTHESFAAVAACLLKHGRWEEALDWASRMHRIRPRREREVLRCFQGKEKSSFGSFDTGYPTFRSKAIYYRTLAVAAAMNKKAGNSQVAHQLCTTAQADYDQLPQEIPRLGPASSADHARELRLPSYLQRFADCAREGEPCVADDRALVDGANTSNLSSCETCTSTASSYTPQEGGEQVVEKGTCSEGEDFFF